MRSQLEQSEAQTVELYSFIGELLLSQGEWLDYLSMGLIHPTQGGSPLREREREREKERDAGLRTGV
jgi:hypothetical protein